MPAGGDLSLYDARRDWASKGDARHAFYDLVRDSGMTHAQAQHYAELGAAKFAEQQGDTGAVLGTVRVSTQGRPRFRVPFDWETTSSPVGDVPSTGNGE